MCRSLWPEKLRLSHRLHDQSTCEIWRLWYMDFKIISGNHLVYRLTDIAKQKLREMIKLFVNEIQRIRISLKDLVSHLCCLLQLHLGVVTFYTFWVMDYIEVFARQQSNDHNKLAFFFETDKLNTKFDVGSIIFLIFFWISRIDTVIFLCLHHQMGFNMIGRYIKIINTQAS